MKKYAGCESFATRFIAWVIICFQLLPVLLGSLVSTVHAAKTPRNDREQIHTPSTVHEWMNQSFSDKDGNSSSPEAHRLATTLSAGGNLLSDNPDSDTFKNAARGLATSEATRQVQNWLGKFGTARVSIDVDDKFSLKNSQLDLLVPLHERENDLIFTQSSLHHTDGRSQLNAGLGYRAFTGSWMAGANAFLDHDISRGHSRLGLGVEYARDYLKFSGNTYRRLTGWKTSPDLTDYQERPANGWDIRVNGWLPDMPQIGGKLTYEQYYGDEVSLQGPDKRLKDPSAVTVGVNYTPVPLVSLNAEHKEIKGGGSDSKIGIDFTYHFGVPLRTQTDPAAVAYLHSLAGSRYDLVERNNNIVLEYRKNEVIRLNTVALISGSEGEKKSLGVQVKSKYGLKEIRWNAPSLTAAGGKIIEEGNGSYSVVLPQYRLNSAGGNSHTITAIAVDVKGNQSNQTETQVTVQSPLVDAGQSTITTDRKTYIVGDEIRVSVVLKNAAGLPVTTANSYLTGDAVTVDNAQLKAGDRWVQTSDGVYSAVFIAAQTGDALMAAVKFPFWRSPVTSATYAINSGNLAAEATSSVATDATSYTAGEKITLTATLKDADNKPVTGASALLAEAGIIVPNAVQKARSSWTDNGDGTYAATWTAAAAGTGLRATLQLSGWSGAVQSAAYAIRLPVEAPASIITHRNAYTFAQTSEEGTFPTTGFAGAEFTIVPKDNKSVTDYSWTVDAIWVTVKDGVVKLGQTGYTGDKVTITGTPKSGQGKIIKYSFTLKNWFISSSPLSTMTWSQANMYCSERNLSQPTVQQLNGNASHTTGTRGTLGGLWSEWGDMEQYNSGFSISYWSSEQVSSGSHYSVALNDAQVYSSNDSDTISAVCRKDL